MQETPQLHMIWPSRKPVDTAALNVAPEYSIRTYRPGDEADFLELMAKTNFDPWDDERLRYNMSRVLPNGWFFAVEDKSGKIVGTAMCLHNYTGNGPFAGDVGWLACDPEHQGHGLGFTLTARVTARFLSAGYERIQLHTEHYRLPAIKIYLKLGYVPVLGSPEMHTLWQEACERIDWEVAPDKWLQEGTRQSNIDP